MFNVGGPEFLVIILVALIVLGPQQLPKAMRTFGSVMAEVRKVSSSFQAEVRNAMDATVETSGSEKPQSGSMAAAGRTPANTSDDAVTEVVARNDQLPAAQPHDAPPHDAPPQEHQDARPAIDPADRAAG